MTRYARRSIAFAVALSGLAGYVDAIGFLSAGRFFVSFMSGNSTRLGIGIAEGQGRYALLAGGVVLLFVAGVVVGTLTARRAEDRRKPFVLLLVSALLFAAALARSMRIPHVGMAALLMAMGAENAIFLRRGEVSIGLTYVTGTLVRLGQRLARALVGGPRWAWVPYLLLWMGLVTGATLGGLAHARLTHAALWPCVAYALLLTAAATRVRPRYS